MAQTELDQKLEAEVFNGIRHQEIWDEFIAPFFTNKEQELYQLFKQAPSDDVKTLTRIKQQLNVLSGMEAHFMHYIDTGKMAKQQLNGDNDE